MKNYKFLILILLTVGFFTGCSDDFLDEPKPTGGVTGEVVFTSREGAEALISGMMRVTRDQFSTGATDTGGLYSIFFARDVKGNDVIQGNNWFGFDYAHENREPTYRRVRFTWEFCYYMINQANSLINGVTESPSISDADKDYLLSQGLALRAYYYFQLVMEYQQTYAYDPSLPALPIYTELSLEGKGLSTVQEVYDQILSDLTTARDIGVDYRLDKSYINLNVINGMLANVYLVMENWDDAETAAHAAYQGFPLNAEGYDDGFNDMENPEWIWAMPQTLDQTNYYYGAPHAFTDHIADSYKATYFNSDFVDLFSTSDVRNIFRGGATGGNSSNYFYYVSDKFTFTFDADHSLMRTPEFMLVEAEAKARQNDFGLAHDLLYAVQVNRDPNAVRSSNTGNALIEEILLERRKELYSEIGIEWFDAKRLRRGIDRTGNHRIFVTLEPDDKRFVLKIPQVEIDANPNITEAVNNGK